MKVNELVDRLVNTGEWLDVIIDGEKSTVGYDGGATPVIVQIVYNTLSERDVSNVFLVESFKSYFNDKNIEVMEQEEIF